VVELDQLPRTLNGKIDRKALPALEAVRSTEEDGEIVPRNPVEELVAGIWCEVLKLPSVGRTSNFFNLGGHSLLVTQVLARVREYLQVEMPIRSLFEAPTVEQFAELVQEQISAGKQSELPEIGRVPREGELPLSFAQQRMWFFDQLSSGTSAFNIALGVRLKGKLNIAALEQTLGEIMRRHEGLRTIFPARDDRPVQIIQPPAKFDLPLVDLSQFTEDERESQAIRLAQEETLRVFDLAHGPLVRPTLLRMDDAHHILICTMQHIIGDGQSFEVVIAEMSQIYSAFSQGQPSPLADLSVQYVDFAAWQRQWLQGEVLDKRLAYWRKQLEDAPQRLNLPQRWTRPKVQRFGGAKHEIKISPELTASLRELSRREGMTLYMTMLSAFVLLLNLYTDDEDIVVGSTHANRERAEAERLIGILVNTLILRLNLTGLVTFRDIMRRVREVCLDAYTYQLPPELIRQDLGERGDEQRLFDVWFQFERERNEKFDMQGLEVTPYEDGKEQTRFELSMSMGEHEKEIVGLFEYDNQLFTAETTAQMLEDYFRLLALMVENPERELSSFSLVNEDESKQYLVANLEID